MNICRNCAHLIGAAILFYDPGPLYCNTCGAHGETAPVSDWVEPMIQRQRAKLERFQADLRASLEDGS